MTWVLGSTRQGPRLTLGSKWVGEPDSVVPTGYAPTCENGWIAGAIRGVSSVFVSLFIR